MQTESLRRVIVGTAGHIDHGKTKLVEALTGIDCDRWIEEKERGITIDLGFAFLREGDLQIGFIDVPGHERFVHNALAGLGGIRIVLLVVAADEGVKPQTLEHLDICSLLEIPACLVALTKIDLVASDVVELARMEVEEILASTPFAGAQILPVSSHTMEGMAELRAALLELAERNRTLVDPARPIRMPVDRAFHLKGLGVVVTGTLVSGVIATGDSLEVQPGARSTRIRSVQVHGIARERAEAGERTALQLSAIDLAEVRRGSQLLAPGRFRQGHTLMGRFTLLASAPKSIKGSTAIRLHLYSSEVQGRLRPLAGPLAPGATGAVELRLAQSVVAVRGDRFIVRRPSPAMTLGGGEILDPHWHRRRGAELATAVEALGADIDRALPLWVSEAQEAGAEAGDLAKRLAMDPLQLEQRLKKLLQTQQVLEIPAASGRPARYLAPAVYRRVAERAQKVLVSYFKRQRLAQGIPKAEAIERILPRKASGLADIYLRWLEAQKILAIDGELINLKGREAALTAEESQLAKDILGRFRDAGLEPPPPKEVCGRLGAKPQIFDGVVQYLLDRGDLARLPGGLLISAAALGRVANELRAGEVDRFSVGDFKSRYGLTRKWAIPILEYLDSSGVTRRIGDLRQVVRTSS